MSLSPPSYDGRLLAFFYLVGVVFNPGVQRPPLLMIVAGRRRTVDEVK
jgi:hypothetical protein